MQLKILHVLLFTLLSHLTIAKKVSFNEQFRQLVSDDVDKSFIISPLSLRTSLTLLYLGTEAETANEIEISLGMVVGTKRQHAQKLNELFKRITTTVRFDGGPKIHIANRIFLSSEFSILPTYNELTNRYFNASAENINFAEKIEATKRINDWIGEETEYKIENIVSPDSITADTQLLLLSTIYFNASWRIPFLRKSIRQDFLLNSTQKVTVEMMRQIGKYRFGKLQQLNAQAIELPYIGTNIKMLVILPNKIDGLRDLELQLKKRDVRKLHKRLGNHLLRVELPKFNITHKQSLDGVLKKMGITHIFRKANFSSLTNANVGLSVSQIEQAALIEVNEHGTVAAAVTKAGIIKRQGLPTTNLTFRADHPFLFVILNFDIVLFSGRVNSF